MPTLRDILLAGLRNIILSFQFFDAPFWASGVDGVAEGLVVHVFMNDPMISFCDGFITLVSTVLDVLCVVGQCTALRPLRNYVQTES